MKKTEIIFIIVKVAVMFLFVRGFTIIETSINPIIQNHLAINQLSNSSDSFVGIRLYTECVQHSWLLIICVAFVLFFEDVAKIIKLLKGKGVVKNDKNNS